MHKNHKNVDVPAFTATKQPTADLPHASYIWKYLFISQFNGIRFLRMHTEWRDELRNQLATTLVPIKIYFRKNIQCELIDVSTIITMPGGVVRGGGGGYFYHPGFFSVFLSEQFLRVFFRNRVLALTMRVVF